MSISGTPANVSGSSGLTSNSNEDIRRVHAAAAPSPQATPTAASLSPWPTNRRLAHRSGKPEPDTGVCGVRRLAGQFRLTGYDAAYLELANRHKLPIASLDKALSKAALAAGINTVQA